MLVKTRPKRKRSKVPYWTPATILPYQRRFNFINAIRNVGKTYNTLLWVLDKCLEKGDEFIYLVRTQDEKKEGALQDGFAKVIREQFDDLDFKFTNDEMCLDMEEDNQLLGYCIALTEAVKIKKRSYPGVKYMIMDEYMLEDWQKQLYVHGWKEPDLFLSIYHTVDRQEDRVICFMLGNNTSFYNPYHMHKAFRIPMIDRGQIWTSKNVLFQWAVPSDELEELKKSNKFVQMISDSDYGKYASHGVYSDEALTFIEKRSKTAKFTMGLTYKGVTYGVWLDLNANRVYIDTAYDPSGRIYALTLDDHTENTLLTKGHTIPQLKWLARVFYLGCVRFVSMEVKVCIESGIALIL